MALFEWLFHVAADNTVSLCGGGGVGGSDVGHDGVDDNGAGDDEALGDDDGEG